VSASPQTGQVNVAAIQWLIFEETKYSAGKIFDAYRVTRMNIRPLDNAQPKAAYAC
jgi:hypothetical protein